MIDKTLFAIQEEYLETLNELDEWFINNPEEDEVPEEFLERLFVNKDEVASKLRNYKIVIDQYEASIKAIKAEKARLDSLIKRKTNQISYLKSRISEATKLYGSDTTTGKYSFIKPNKRIDTELIKVSFIRQFPVIVKDESTIPEKYFDYSVNLPEVLDKETAELLVDTINNLGLIDDLPEVVASLNTKRLQNSLKSNETIEGAILDVEKGYIRIS